MKKILFLSMCAIFCIAFLSCGQDDLQSSPSSEQTDETAECTVPTESETATPTESETATPTEEYVLPPGPPYRFDLSSSNEELREFLAVAQKTEEESYEKYRERYEKYRSQKKGTPWEKIDFDDAKRIAFHIADLEIPLLKEGVVCEDSVLQYYIRFALDKNNKNYEIDELQVIYTLDGVRYYFTYDFTNLRLFDLEEEPVFKDVRLDSLTFDVYQIPGSQRLYGGVVFEKYALTVQVYKLPDGAVFSLDALTLGPITDFGLSGE